MSDTEKSKTGSEDGAPRSSLLRRLVIAAGILVVLLVVLFFVATSGGFIRAVVLPRVGDAINAKLTAGDVSLSPFSQLTLRQLKVETTGTEPVFQAEEVVVRYKLFAIMGGNIDVPEITVTGPTLNVVQQADGKSNLDPLIQGKGPAQPKAVGETKTPQVDLKKIALSKGTIRFTRLGKDGSKQTSEVANLQIGVEQVRNGQAGKLTLGADVIYGTTPAPKSTNQADLLKANLAGSFDFALDASLMPSSAKGDLRLSVSQGDGAFKELSGFVGALGCDMTPSELRQVSLRFERGGQALGRIQVSGPLDLVKRETRLKVEISAIDRAVLNPFGASRGMDFGETAINGSAQVDVSHRGDTIDAKGKISVARFSIRQAKKSTPSLDMDTDWQITVNLADGTAIVQKLALQGKQAGRDLLSAALDRPMNISWGESVHGINEATVKLGLSDLNLSDWGMFLPTNAPVGKVSAACKITSQQDGRLLSLDASARVDDLTASFGTNRLDRAGITASLQGKVADFDALTVDRFALQVTQHNRGLVSATGSASYNTKTEDTSVQLVAQTDLENLVREFPVAGVNPSGGSMTLNALYAKAKEKQTATAKMNLNNLAGQFFGYRLDSFQVGLETDTELKGTEIALRRATLSVQQGVDVGGTVDLGGKLDTTHNTGDFTFNIVNLNQFGLRPFLAPYLVPNTLTSAAIEAKGTAHYDAASESILQVQARLSKFVVTDPANKLPKIPLEAQLQMDAAQRGGAIDLRKFVVSFSPTARATNQVEMRAKLDFSPTNAAPSTLSLFADSLDFTPIYDLLTTNKPAAEAKAPATAQPAATASNAEPGPIALPFKEFTGDLKINRLFLRELAISNWVATAKITNGVVILKPFDLSLNGAPLTASATIDLKQQGYVYDLEIKADRLPIEPMANTFTPDQKGQYVGEINANAQIKGAGVTGASLQKNLTGQVAFSMTNLNFQVVSARAKKLLTPIALVLGVQELLTSPLNVVAANADLGGGRVDLKQFVTTSPAFYASSQGTIQFAAILTNSPLNLPVQFALRRALAEKIKFTSGTQITNTDYVTLPQFVKVVGTLGDPKTETDKTRVAGMLAGGIAGAVGGKAGDVLQSVGSLLKGENPLSTATSTNQLLSPKSDAKTNALTKTNVINLLNNLFQKK